MSTEQNKAVARQFVEEVFNRGNISKIDEFMAPDFMEREELPPGIPCDCEGVKNADDHVAQRLSGLQSHDR